MYEYLLTGGALIATGIGILLVFLAGDIQRRRLRQRRRWYEHRLHVAIDRVEAVKMEMEPPLEGVLGFATASRAPEPTPPESNAAGDPAALPSGGTESALPS